MGKGIADQLKQEFDLDVTWVPFEIHPEIPPEGVLVSVLFPLMNQEAMANGLTQSGKPYGIGFKRLDRLYNSRKALELSELARDRGIHGKVHDLIFRAYFQEGKNISDTEVLCDIAEEAGLDRITAKEALDAGVYNYRLGTGSKDAQDLGITAVPAFVFDDGQILIGAQPLDTFKNALEGRFLIKTL